MFSGDGVGYTEFIQMLMPAHTAHTDIRQPVALQMRRRLALQKVASACLAVTPCEDSALRRAVAGP